MTTVTELKRGMRVRYTGPSMLLTPPNGRLYGLHGQSVEPGDEGVLNEVPLTEFVRVDFEKGRGSVRVTELEVVPND